MTAAAKVLDRGEGSLRSLAAEVMQGRSWGRPGASLKADGVLSHFASLENHPVSRRKRPQQPVAEKVSSATGLLVDLVHRRTAAAGHGTGFFLAGNLGDQGFGGQHQGGD